MFEIVLRLILGMVIGAVLLAMVTFIYEQWKKFFSYRKMQKDMQRWRQRSTQNRLNKEFFDKIEEYRNDFV